MRIMFISAHCLLDRSSGAALSMTTQLECLARRGWSCRSVTASVFDNMERLDPAVLLARWGVEQIGTLGFSPVWGVRRNYLEHVILPFADTRRHFATAVEELLFYNLAREQIKDWKPDIVYCYGGWLLERSILRGAKKLGLPTAFLLINSNYSDPASFEDADLIFTPTQWLSDNYFRTLGIASQPIGEFVDPASIKAERSSPDMVLFVNPSLEKGVTMFIEIARQCLKQLPEVKFLLVESRATSRMISEKFGIDWNDLPNIEIIPQQSDMRPVYARARLVLFPAYWNEAAGRTIYEAQANGIPVLASRHGAIPETLAGGGFLFDIPERCRADHSQFPMPEDAVPWVDCIKSLVTDSSAMDEAVARAFAASETYNLELLAESLESRLRKLAAPPAP